VLNHSVFSKITSFSKIFENLEKADPKHFHVDFVTTQSESSIDSHTKKKQLRIEFHLHILICTRCSCKKCRWNIYMFLLTHFVNSEWKLNVCPILNFNLCQINVKNQNQLLKIVCISEIRIKNFSYLRPEFGKILYSAIASAYKPYSHSQKCRFWPSDTNN
jgi:hypothetical protein